MRPTVTARAALAALVFLAGPVVALAEDAAHGGSDEQPHSAFPPFDPHTFGSTLFWLVVVFGVLYWLMSRIALPRVGETIQKRDETIAADLDRASLMQKKAEEAGEAYQAALAKARANAVAIGQRAKDEASAKAAERRKATEQEVSSRIAAAEQQIAATKLAAMGNVEAIASDAAASIVQHLSGISPSESEVREAVRQAIAG